ncbi:uncharacterized protein HD556DRAFT_1443270 [Suillus plorans]|uniref:DRBM domain-containing protein n=1 Tax=Suillus plorans TaxID=116603 RepID=A0A9P7DGZ4_9AGAM|nr:uncharacterized protein HD556DRAFT_1443270 [Suillus plorans]KAG1793889.1 hypothetical protein HD556DRAFT_1443270 [Suillus plorans]
MTLPITKFVWLPVTPASLQPQLDELCIFCRYKGSDVVQLIIRQVIHTFYFLQHLYQILAAMSGDDHPRTKMNNELQRIYGPSAPDHVRWDVYSRGSPNALTWYATVYIDDINHGDASSRTRGGAQDEAAKQAYNWLRYEVSRR